MLLEGCLSEAAWLLSVNIVHCAAFASRSGELEHMFLLDHQVSAISTEYQIASCISAGSTLIHSIISSPAYVHSDIHLKHVLLLSGEGEEGKEEEKTKTRGWTGWRFTITSIGACASGHGRCRGSRTCPQKEKEEASREHRSRIGFLCT